MSLKSISEKAKSTYAIIILVFFFSGGTYWFTKSYVLSIIVGTLVIIFLIIWDLHDRLKKIEKT